MAFVDAWDAVTGEHTRGGFEPIKTWEASATPEGFLLRRLRWALRLNLVEAARALGWGVAETSAVERGVRIIRRRDFRAVCEHLVAAPRGAL